MSTDACIATFPAGHQNVSIFVGRGRPGITIKGLPAVLAASTERRVRAAMGQSLPTLRIIVDVIRPGGAYASPEVDAAIVAGISDLSRHVA